jgi:hypothetical protein
VLKVLEIASTYYPLLETVSALISQLDVLCAFALVSSTHQYVKPIICQEEKEQVYMIESKHPLIHIQDPATCINNDCRMVRNKSNLQIITGPNMGGKSTYIRQVAICVLLAHIGKYLFFLILRMFCTMCKGRNSDSRLYYCKSGCFRSLIKGYLNIYGRDVGGFMHVEGKLAKLKFLSFG